MNNGVSERKHFLCGNWIFEDVQIIKSNNASILHGSPFVFMSKDLIIFIEREFVAEKLLEEFHTLNRNFEHERGHFL